MKKAKPKIDPYHKKLKKDYVDVEEKVTRPNFRKYLRDKIDMKIRVTPELSDELQKIAFEEGVKWVSGRAEALYTEEPVFYIATYVFNKLAFGSFKLYIVLITFIQYFLIFISIHKYWKANDKNLIIFAIIIFAIFNRFFFMSSHLMRQLLAGSIFVYFFITFRTIKVRHPPHKNTCIHNDNWCWGQYLCTSRRSCFRRYSRLCFC